MQMMGGKLERATDEVAELVASRPAWMSGDPATFNEEQLREYKEYCAKEQAAIEERLKRKAVMVSSQHATVLPIHQWSCARYTPCTLLTGLSATLPAAQAVFWWIVQRGH